MKRFWAAVALFPLMSLLLLRPGSARVADEPTATVQPTAVAFEVDVVVETQGMGIPDNFVMETNLGNGSLFRHEDLGPNHYRDFVRVKLDSEMMWIFSHEGDLGVGGTRNDESWELFPVIVPTPFTLTVSVHNPGMPCPNATIGNCNNVTGIGNQPVFTLDHNKTYNLDLRVDYTRGASSDQDYFTVTSTIQ